MGRKRNVDESSLTTVSPTKNSRQKKSMENDGEKEPPSEDEKPRLIADGSPKENCGNSCRRQ